MPSLHVCGDRTALVLLQMSSLNQCQRDWEPRDPCSEALLRDTQFDP